MTIRDLPSAERRWLAIAAAFCAALSLLLFGADFTVDGLTYAVRVETGRHLYHANHMLPNYVWWVLQQGLDALGWAPRAVITMQAFNVIFGLAGCVVLYGVLRSFASVTNSSLLILLIFFSFGWWAFSHEPEVYVPALALICFQLPWLLDSQKPGRWQLVALVALCAATIGFHQQHVLWYFVALALLWRQAGSIRDKGLWTFALAVPALVLALYVVIGLQHGAFESTHSIAEWFLGLAYSEDGGVSTHRATAAPLHRLALALAAAGNLLVPWTLVAQPIWVIGLAALALFALFGVLLWAAWSRREKWAELRWIAGLALAWLLVYFFFALVWEARNVEFMLPLLLPAAVLAAIVLGNHRSRLLVAAVAVLVALNLALSHVPDSQVPLRYSLALAVDDQYDLTLGDALITEEKNTVLYLNYMRGKPVKFIAGAVSHAMHLNVATERFERQFRGQIRRSDRVFTLEQATRGRLYWMAKRLPWVSENSMRDVDTLEERLYDRLIMSEVPGLENVWQVSLPHARPAR
ncbi:MAG: hypothetical protein DHS20C11_30190 [Lysobacteraceae bacterium]|nr:MAG: hypothetical protein DHS20C11_30190 [Xanthomonadaceae bacterium]